MVTEAHPHVSARAAQTRRELDARDFWAWVWESLYPAFGWILIAVGAIIVGLGWWGVSRTAIVAQQLPYLASGGVGGIALIVLGSRFLVIRDLRRDSGRLDRLERMVADLHHVLLIRTDDVAAGARYDATTTGPIPPVGLAAGSLDGAADGYVIAAHGTRYHRPDCRVVAGKANLEHAGASDLRERGLQPCPLCEPADLTS
jgi:hypothetical protein